MTTLDTQTLVDVREGHRFDVAALERYLTPLGPALAEDSFLRRFAELDEGAR